MNEAIELDINDICREIKRNLKRAGWGKEQTEKYLLFKYLSNKILKLSDDELIEFMNYTATLPNFSLFKIKPLKLRVLPESTKQLEAVIEPAF